MIEININASITRLNFDTQFKEQCNFDTNQITLCKLLYGTLYTVNNSKYFTETLDIYGKNNTFYSTCEICDDKHGFYTYYDDNIDDVYKNTIYNLRKNTLDDVVYNSQVKKFLKDSDILQLDELMMHEKVVINDKKYIIELTPYQIIYNPTNKFKDNSILPFLYHCNSFKLQHFLKKHQYFKVIYRIRILSCKNTSKSIECKIIERQEKRKYLIKCNTKTIIRRTPLLNDEELIKLFDDNKPKKKNKKKESKCIEMIDTINDAYSDTIEEDAIDEIIDTTSDSDDSSSSIIDKSNNFIVIFNVNKYFTEHSKRKIINYINDLYETSINFQNVMQEYESIKILKGLHKDYSKKENSLHFTGVLKNITKESKVYHFYINETGIYSITEINNLI